ncbi:sugar transferase [Flavobacterium sp.]|uniref:sugar transferase n=1 Tax=Flavobacterium sp. TaxID=239 RepID=UPI0040476B2A
MYKNKFKRIFDFVIVLFAFLLISPIFILLTLGLMVSNGGNPFFFQKRPGKNNRIFTIIKFKTMNDKRDANGNLLPDFQRLTPFGSFVRKLSLDEVPQLLNVIKGDMSLIGPRPLLVSYLPLYSKEQNRRHEVRPGITGWAQVNGRNAISWEQKFQYDVWYVENTSFLLDLKIIYLTILKVVRREDINNSEEVTMKPFKGNS